MTAGLLILGVFLVAAMLMFFRALPALLALPLMAVAIVSIEIAAGRLGFSELALVLADGATRLADAMVIVMLGGMLSSLVHILIVTPVIFLWLRARELKRASSTARGPACGS